MKTELPLCIDLFCGLFGWSAGFVAEGWRCVGFDIAKMGPVPEGCKLVIQDVLTIHGSQFKDAAVIVASPPCQKYSWLAMPWSRSPDFVRPDGDGWEILNSAAAKKMLEEWTREGPDNRLFDACFRIQREAIEALQRKWFCRHPKSETCDQCFIPLIVENVRGAQPWVGRAAWSYGSFYLWGDVPALMPFAGRIAKVGSISWNGYGTPGYKAQAFNTTAEKRLRDGEEISQPMGQKVAVYSDPRRNGGKGSHLTCPDENIEKLADGLNGGDWFSDPKSTCRKHGSRSAARKAASAQIAKIPFELARHIAATYRPRRSLAQETRLRFAAGKS